MGWDSLNGLQLLTMNVSSLTRPSKAPSKISPSGSLSEGFFRLEEYGGGGGDLSVRQFVYIYPFAHDLNIGDKCREGKFIFGQAGRAFVENALINSSIEGV